MCYNSVTIHTIYILFQTFKLNYLITPIPDIFLGEAKRMKNSMWKKALVLGIVLLFIGTSIVPITGMAENNNKPILLEKQIGSCGDILFERLIVKLMELVRMSALSAAIIKDNEVVWAKGYGLYDRGNTKEADDYTIFLMASISKTFTATAIMQLYERGFFDLDDDVNEYLPFSLRNPIYSDTPITFRMLLSHRSGLATEPDYPRPTFIRMVPGGLEMVDYPDPFLREYLIPGGIHYKPQVWTDSRPGEKMHYANIGYAVLGYLVELISDQPFEEYCREHIFEPLGMYNSSFRVANLNVSRLAVPYDFQSGEYYPYMHYDTVDYPASGLRASALDLSHFLIAHMNGGVYNGARILEEETVDQMHSPENGSRYGLGWQIWEKSTGTYVGHSGGMHGVATKMIFRQSDNVGIIFFINERVWNYREQFAFSSIERLLFWKANGF